MPRCTLVFLVVLALTVTAFYPFAGGSGFSGRAEAAELSTSKGVACSDTSRHITRFVRIERRAQLEVLDWGGSGDLLVFLTGLGNSAHIFDNFAYQFTDRFRVIGITRRGYGQSSQTPQGYDLATRVADIIKVLDYFNFDKAIFVGHSIAGVELSRLGSAYPDRVSKLVYLDAYDYGELHNQIPPAAGPESMATARDGYSPQHGDAFSARYMGYRGVTADTCNIARIGPSGAVGSAKTPAWITSTIIQNSGVADFDLITAPTLGIFAHPQAIPPYVSQLSTEQQEAFDLSMQSLEVWQEDVYQRMSAGIPDFQIHLLSNAAHYIFLTNEAEVVRHMRAFLLGE
ncbi:MAG: alpha/beta hydrolase [Desulfobacteraceae bacterium]|nr:alpha/beta hydrolase [Desulfobacteraceae bacterium]